MTPTMRPPMTGTTMTSQPRWLCCALEKISRPTMKKEEVCKQADQLVESKGYDSSHQADCSG